MMVQRRWCRLRFDTILKLVIGFPVKIRIAALPQLPTACRLVELPLWRVASAILKWQQQQCRFEDMLQC